MPLGKTSASFRARKAVFWVSSQRVRLLGLGLAAWAVMNTADEGASRIWTCGLKWNSFIFSSPWFQNLPNHNAYIDCGRVKLQTHGQHPWHTQRVVGPQCKYAAWAQIQSLSCATLGKREWPLWEGEGISCLTEFFHWPSACIKQ